MMAEPNNDTTPAATVHDALVNRRSIRDFSDRPVPTDVIRDIVSDALWTPSWENMQPWRLYVATGDTAKAIKNGYRNKAALGLQSGSEVPVTGADWDRDSKRNIAAWGVDMAKALGAHTPDMQASQRLLFNAPTIAVITVHKNVPVYEYFDAGAFEQSVLLSAYAHGVDTIPAVAFVHYPAFVRAQLGIPDDEALVCGIGMGYRSNAKVNDFRSGRMDLDQVLTIKE